MDEAVISLRRELAGRYAIDHELGHGGMAVVYLAKDLKHDRRVAVKVLRSDLGGADAADRFLREIRTVAQLHHPHILGLHDSGTAGEHPFYVMPYVDGETLRQRLERGGALSVEEAVRIARETADALDFAHARGIVHRDIKPENIFLSAGHALVGDFGIARAADAAGLTATTLTEAGLAVGTPAYMSPEQATADPRVDGRSDQYALGCVLYEMRAGQPPFTGPTSQAIMARHTSDIVPPLSTVRAIPPALEAAIMKSLAKVPADRWPSTKAFAESLDAATPHQSAAVAATTVVPGRPRFVQLAAVSLVIGLAFVAYKSIQRAPAAESASTNAAIRSVALRPFSYSGDTAYAWLGESFANGLLPGLIKIQGVGVKSPEQSNVEATRADDPVEVGRILNVDAVLSGEVQVRGNLLRVSARLTSVADGTLRWQGNMNGELEVEGQPQDFYRITDSLAVEIVGALRPELNEAHRAVAQLGPRTNSLEALALLHRARAEAGVARTGASWERARKLAAQALEIDPNFSDAMVFLHEATVSSLMIAGRTPAEASAAVEGLLDRAIRADSLNADAYAIRARYRAAFKWEWDESLTDYRKALSISPSSPNVLIEIAFAMNERDQRDSAVVYMRRAFDLMTVDAGSLHDLSVTLYLAGRTDSAHTAAMLALTMNPGWTNYLVPMHTLLDKGRVAEADSMATRYLEGGYAATQALSYAAAYFMRSGNKARAREMSDSILAHTRREYVSASEVATAWLAIGDTAKALDAVDRAVRQHDIMLPQNMWFLLSPLNGQPRFEKAVRAVYGNRPARRSFR